MLFVGGGALGYWYARSNAGPSLANSQPTKYTTFLLELWDRVKGTYWKKIDNEDLANLYKLAAEKITEKPQALRSATRESVGIMLERIIQETPADKQHELVTNLADMVLYNLEPAGRSRLYTTKKEQALRQEVKNIDTSTNLYDTLGVAKEASPEEVESAFDKKSQELEKNTSPEGKQKLAQVTRAYEALGEQGAKQVYDQTGAEPTVVGQVMSPDIFYIKLKRFSPTTADEFQAVANATSDKPELTSLILDLRGNIGGAIDLLPYFLGFFIGQNQYAYEVFHQSEPTAIKTKLGYIPSLVKFKKVVILIDGQTQSSAEVTAAVLKRFNVGVVIGERTRGWGTIENTFPFETKIDDDTYMAFLVHSLTLREDGLPIQDNGVEPTIKLTDKNWDKQLLTYFNYSRLVEAVREVTR